MRGSTKRVALAAGVLLLGCGGDEESKMERGLVVDREEAAPGSAREYEMTEAERQRALEDEDAKLSAEEFDRAAGEQ